VCCCVRLNLHLLWSRRFLKTGCRFSPVSVLGENPFARLDLFILCCIRANRYPIKTTISSRRVNTDSNKGVIPEVNFNEHIVVEMNKAHLLWLRHVVRCRMWLLL